MMRIGIDSNHMKQSFALRFKVSENDKSDTALLDLDDDDDEDDNESGELFYPDILQKLSKGIIPLAASLGFTLTPSSRIITRVIGAATGGMIGYLMKTMMEKNLKSVEDNYSGGSGGSGDNGSIFLPSSVKNALNIILHDNNKPPSSLTLAMVEKIAKKCKVAEDKLGLLFTTLFSELILQAVQEDSMDLTELSIILDFANNMELSSSEVGDGFSLAVSKLSEDLPQDDRGFYITEVTSDLLYQSSKVFFLADKMLGSSDGYYGKRVSTGLCFYTVEEFQTIITDACTKLFRRCIESVFLTPDSFTKVEVDGLKEFITTSSKVSSLRPATMENMISEGIQYLLDQTMSDKESVMTTKVVDYDKLVKAQSILGWNERELSAVITTRTFPIFVEATKKILAIVIDKPDEAEELSIVLQDRINDLNIDPLKARALINTLVSDMNSNYMNRINKVYEASDGALDSAFKIMVGYAHTHAALKTLTSKVMADTPIPLPGLPFADMVRVSMFEMQQSKGGDKSGVSSDMFDLNDDQRKVVRKHLALPKVCSWISQCIKEHNLADEAKSAYEKLLSDYGVSHDEWLATAVDFYYQEVNRISNARAVPTIDDINDLNLLKQFLSIEYHPIVSKVNLELFGDKYVKALSEAMTPTGVITEEYIHGLERLRIRLGLTEQDGYQLLNVASRSRMSPIIKDLVDIWKSDTDATYRREQEKKASEKGKVTKRDKSGDPISSLDNVFGYMEVGAQKDGGGPNVFMREAINLVDFFDENYKIITNTIDIDDDKDVDDEDEDVDDDVVIEQETESNTNLESTSIIKSRSLTEVTASGIVPEADLAGMYKHYLITRLAERDDELRQRYSDVDMKFAKILGLTKKSQVKIKQSLAYSAYKGMLVNLLQYKGIIEPQDTSQFLVLKDSLKLSQDSSTKIYNEATRDAVVEHAAKLFRDSENGMAFTPEIAKTFREQVQSLGLDMQKDTGFNERLITYLYALEVQYLIENGQEIELNDIQQSYDIPVDRAQEIIEACCKKYLDQLINLGLRSARKFDDKNTILWIKKILKYAIFVTTAIDADANLFSEDDKKQLIAVYQTEVDLKQDQELMNIIEQYADINLTEKLRELINLTEEYVAPLQGMEGLMGNGKSFKQMEDDKYNEQDNGKKAWAWG